MYNRSTKLIAIRTVFKKFANNHVSRMAVEITCKLEILKRNRPLNAMPPSKLNTLVSDPSNKTKSLVSHWSETSRRNDIESSASVFYTRISLYNYCQHNVATSQRDIITGKINSRHLRHCVVFYRNWNLIGCGCSFETGHLL